MSTSASAFRKPIALILALVAPLLMAADEPKLIPDSEYVPDVGDRAELYSEKLGECMCATHGFYYRDYYKSLMIDDDAGMNELLDKGNAFYLINGTKILLLEREDFPARDKIEISDAWVVRILNGPHRGEKVYTAWYNVARLIEEKKEPTPPPTALALYAQAETLMLRGDQYEALRFYESVVSGFPDSPQAKQAAKKIETIRAEIERRIARSKLDSLMLLAKNLEKASKWRGALDYYRQVVKDFPNSDEAKVARAKIKAIANQR